MDQAHNFETIDAAKAYALAGNATLTLESLKTGTHFTFKVKAAKDADTGKPVGNKFFVSLLSGPDNESDYQYLGMVIDGMFRLTKASRAGKEAASVKAFSFFMASRELHPALVVHHEGRCCRCGRTLTEPESLRTGWGPECRAKIGLE